MVNFIHMKDYNDLKYTCLFGGGAIRGAAHVGAIKALNELGVEISTVAGSSVGSIIAALLAVGYTEDELAEVFLSVNFELFRDIAFGLTPKFALSKGEVFLDWIRELIEKKYYGDKYEKDKVEHVRFKDLNKNLIIITTNMKKFCCKEFSNFETPDFEVAMAVRISCCMPGLMRAVGLEDQLLVDGDLMKGKPMWFHSKNLQSTTDRILEIRLEGEFSGSDQKPLEYVNGMYSCITYTESDFIKYIYGNKDKYDYILINTGDVVVVDFNYPREKRYQIINNGYTQTLKYFKKNLVIKKHIIGEVYSTILDDMRKIQGYFLSNKYNAGKNTIAESFIYLADKKDIIDIDVYKAIQKFQKLLYSNIKTGLLGYSTCKNKDKVKELMFQIIEDLTCRIAEIDKYIAKYSD